MIDSKYGEQAQVLIQALPYLQRYIGKTIVIKYGGAAMTDEAIKATVMQDLILMSCVGIRTVLVHGGGPEIDALMGKLGMETRRVRGLRYTDSGGIDVVQEVLAGKVNKQLVSLIQAGGGKAVGLCGIDGGLFKARRVTADGEDLGFVGDVSSVDPELVESALGSGFIPVVATVASGEEDARVIYNINADTAAAKLAMALKAEKFILLSDVPGILRDVKDPDSLIRAANPPQIKSLIDDGTVSKGMIPKVECCVVALAGGVKRAHIIDGRLPHALLIEVFSDAGIGTMISKD
jgi:acetylglutamate kinase